MKIKKRVKRNNDEVDSPEFLQACKERRERVLALLEAEERPKLKTAMKLLLDMLKILDTKGWSKIRSLRVVSALNRDKDMSWHAIRNGKGIHIRMINEFLGHFYIHSKLLRFNKRPLRGFKKVWLLAALRRIKKCKHLLEIFNEL